MPTSISGAVTGDGLKTSILGDCAKKCQQQSDRRGNQCFNHGPGPRDGERTFKRHGQDNYSGGKCNRNHNDNTVNAVKGQKPVYDDVLEKILAQERPRHPGKGRTLGECRVLTNALIKCTANKKPWPNPKAKNKTADEPKDNEEPQDTNPCHAYRNL